MATAAAYFERAERFSDDLVRLRRDLHENPELGFQESRTAGRIEEELRRLAIPFKTGIAKTGLVADIGGRTPGPTILLRFDMDALPIEEQTGLAFASRNRGVMHACGHDGHVAMGLGAARLLAADSDRMAGRVRIVFQPAEEVIGGAKAMVEAGVHNDLRPTVGYSIHVWNMRPLGWIGATPGPAMAAADTFTIEIRGRGGHGATPEVTKDPVVTAAQVITALQTVVSRNVAPNEAGVVSVTSVHGGEAFNVIPGVVQLQGTIRCYDPAIHAKIRERVDAIAQGVSRALGCEATIAIRPVAVAVRNEPALAKEVRALASTIPAVREISDDERKMGSEDYPFLVEGIPSCYVFLGAGVESKPEAYGHHHAKFDWDERALPIGTALMAACAARHVLP
jgi:amidohydrolase